MAALSGTGFRVGYRDPVFYPNIQEDTIAPNSTRGTLSGTITMDGSPAYRPRLMLLRNGAVVGSTVASSVGVYSFPNLPRYPDYEVIAYGEGVKRSRVIGPGQWS